MIRRGGLTGDHMPAKYAKPAQKSPPMPSKGRQRGSPYTSAIEYDAEEIEFFKAVDEWKRRKGKQFPSLSELLGVLKGLGWRKG